MDTFQVHILAADETMYEGPCVSLAIPTSDGERGILAHHSSMMAAIVPGVLRFRPPEQEEKLQELKCLNQQRNNGIEGIYWELAGVGSHGDSSQLLLIGTMIDKAEISIGEGIVKLALYKDF